MLSSDDDSAATLRHQRAKRPHRRPRQPSPSVTPLKRGPNQLSETDSGINYAPHRREQAGSRVGRAVRRARERSAVRGYRAASAAIAHVPTRVSLPVGRALFVGSYFAWPVKRRIILSNASHVLGLPPADRRVRSLAQRIYATYAQFVIELMRLPYLPADEPTRLLAQLDGDHGGQSFIDLFERLRAQKRGLIAVSGHVGSIDLLAGAFALRGLPTYGLADDSAYPELLEEMNAQRRRWKIEIIPWRNLRRVFSALREPAILGLVVDWGYRPDGIPVRLFGEWTTLPAGPAMLAAKTKAAIVPVVCRRLDDGTYLARHYDPIDVADTSDAEMQRATQLIAVALEDMISTAPEQWYSFKPIWPQTAQEKQALAERALSISGAGA
ncbi:MAG TPA: lysophospholipid acyltransferase family protein [Candidatus Limnocylindrales bacterium]